MLLHGFKCEWAHLKMSPSIRVNFTCTFSEENIWLFYGRNWKNGKMELFENSLLDVHCHLKLHRATGGVFRLIKCSNSFQFLLRKWHSALFGRQVLDAVNSKWSLSFFAAAAAFIDDNFSIICTLCSIYIFDFLRNRCSYGMNF